MNSLVTVITPIYKPSIELFLLIDSLNRQTDKNFHFIIVNGNPDPSLEGKIKDIFFSHCTIISEHDNGFYFALNKGIEKCKTAYYVVAGSDDTFDKNFIKKINSILSKSNQYFDVITGKISISNQAIFPYRPELKSSSIMASSISNHSIGVVVKKKIHNKYGFFDTRFKLAADQLFFSSFFKDKQKVLYCNFNFGNVGCDGISARQNITCLIESYCVNFLTKNSVLYNSILFPYRLLAQVCKKI